MVSLTELTRWLSDPSNSEDILALTSHLLHNNPSLGFFVDNTIKGDIRVTISWCNSEADVELHVYEPNGEHCYSFNNCTSNDGRLSLDCNGYGPEEYFLK